MKKIIATSCAALALYGCTDEHDQLRPFVECSVASGVLNQDDAARDVIKAAWEFKAAHNIDFPLEDGIEMHNKIREEWLEHGKSKQEQIAHLIRVFNSDQCTSLHQRNKISISEIDINKIAAPKNPVN